MIESHEANAQKCLETTKIDAQMFGSNGNEYNNCFKVKGKILTM